METTAEPQRGRPAGLRGNRDWLILWTSGAAGELGVVMGTLAFTLLAMAVTGSPAQAALVGTAFTASLVVATVPAGVLVDRLNRRAVMVTSAFAQAAMYGLVAVAVIGGWATLPLLLASSVVEGVAGAFAGPAQVAALKRIVPARLLGSARAIMDARSQAIGLIGPPLAGALYGLVRWGPFLVDCVGQLVRGIAICLIRTPLPAPERTPEPTSMLTEAREGLEFAWSRPIFRGVMLMAVVTNFAVGGFVVALSLRLIQAGVAPVTIGLVESTIAGASLVGAVLSPAVINRVRVAPLLTTVTIAFVAGGLPIAFTSSVPVICALLPVAFVLVSPANAALFGYATAVVPDAMMGRFMATMNLGAMALSPFAPLAAGLMLEHLGGTLAIAAMAACLPVALIPLLSTRELWQVGLPETWGAADDDTDGVNASRAGDA